MPHGSEARPVPWRLLAAILTATAGASSPNGKQVVECRRCESRMPRVGGVALPPRSSPGAWRPFREVLVWRLPFGPASA
jgi:hypothetical protein